MGGHFERLVRTIKASLASTISKKLLTLEEFVTVVKEAENIVNSRPLTDQSDDSRDILLTPSQLAWGRDITLIPPLLQPGDPLDPDYDVKATRTQYIALSSALERFRKRWLSEYLLSLREKHYNKCADNPQHHLRVGQLDIVKHENLHIVSNGSGCRRRIDRSSRSRSRSTRSDCSSTQSRGQAGGEEASRDAPPVASRDPPPLLKRGKKRRGVLGTGGTEPEGRERFLSA